MPGSRLTHHPVSQQKPALLGTSSQLRGQQSGLELPVVGGQELAGTGLGWLARGRQGLQALLDLPWIWLVPSLFLH